jgi:dTDP-4-dehydrorhamnose 3,5-epimerase
MPLPELTPTALPGVLLVKTPLFGDDRGYFTEAYSQLNWAAAGFTETFVQDNMSCSAAGTLRGMHYQIDPDAQGKYVRVVRGAAFDVAVDIRRGSPTFGKWVGYQLDDRNKLALWIPTGFAHGFLALEDHTLLYYKSTHPYAPHNERAFHYADPAVGIEWPEQPRVLSGKDAAAPPLEQAEVFAYDAHPE